MKEVYQANDGTIFDTEEECREYEIGIISNNHENVWREIALFKANGFPYYVNTLEDFVDAMDQIVYYIVIPDVNPDNLQWLQNYMDSEYRLEIPISPSAYYWDESMRTWVDYKTDYENFCRKWEPVKDAAHLPI